MRSVLLLGGFLPGQSLWSIRRRFLDLGCCIHYLPTRGVIASHRESDELLAAEEAEVIPAADTWETREKLRNKARWWLAHDHEREAAARRAQARILRSDGNVAYARRLLEFVSE